MCDHCGCREFAPIAELTAEHEEILERAWSLAETERAGRTASRRDLDELLQLLEVHVAKEETGLYPQLVARGALAGDTLAELEDEHVQLHAALRSEGFGRRAFYALAAHIEVEEMELFPAAMLGFDDEEWDAMTDAHVAATTTG